MLFYLIKDFNVQDLFLQYSNCKNTSFCKRQLTPSEVAVRNRLPARIHIERAIGRLKKFWLLDHILPL